MKALDRISISFLVTAGTVGGAVSILDLVGTDFESGPWAWLKGTGPITLLLVAILSIALGVERYSQLNEIAKKLDANNRLLSQVPGKIISGLKGVELTSFLQKDQFLRYAAKRIREAKKSVDDLSLGIYASATVETTQAAREAYRAYREAVVHAASKKAFTFREVITIPPQSNIRNIRSVVDRDIPGYRVAYYLLQEQDLPPLSNFLIIDSEEVILILPSTRIQPLAVKHTELVALYREFYESIWRGAQLLARNTADYSAALDRLEKQLAKGAENSTSENLT